MEPDLVGLGRREPLPLLGPDVDDHGALELEGGSEPLLEEPDVVARQHADVGDPEVLEQAPGLGEVDDRRAEPARQLEGGRADDRQASDELVVGASGSIARPATA